MSMMAGRQSQHRFGRKPGIIALRRIVPYAKSFSTTCPLTSVNRKSRPMCRYVSRS